MLEPEDDAGRQRQLAAYEQLKVQIQAPEIANRMALHYTTAQHLGLRVVKTWRSLDKRLEVEVGCAGIMVIVIRAVVALVARFHSGT